MNRIQKHIAYFLACLILTALPVGCVRQNPIREKLDDANRMTDSMPDSAIAILDSIDKEGLSEADRNYHDFLTVKAGDKAYITHTSDSLILKVLEYYFRHSDDKVYPEALYYGGRVYSDLGDLPTALQYFHSALDLLPPETDNKKLRGAVLSQSGRLLNTLRLYDKAAEYILEALKVDSIIGDSVNIMFDTQLLGSVNMRSMRYNNAETLFKKARKMALSADTSAVPLMDMYLAAVKYYKGENDSALSIIRHVVYRVDSVSLDAALGYASVIYLKSNIPDTALLYARRLVEASSYNRETGYWVILSPELKGHIHPDSIYNYIPRYRDMLEESLNQNESHEALIQETLYNYRIHERERARTERENERLRWWLTGAALLIALLGGAFFYKKYRKQGKILWSYLTIDRLKELRVSLTRNDGNIGKTPALTSTSATPKEADGNSMEKRIRDMLSEILKECPGQWEISPTILNSGAYSELLSYLKKDKAISEKNPIWAKLEDVVLADSSDFKYRLNLLAGKNLKTIDYNIVLLIRCGMNPTQVSTLLGKSKSAISYRRAQLSVMAFGQKLDPKRFDYLIRCL